MIVFGGGCTYHRCSRTNLPPSSQLITEWKHGGFWGLARPGPMDLEKLCPQGFHEHGAYAQLGHAVLAVATLGLYLPHTEYVIPARVGHGPEPAAATR